MPTEKRVSRCRPFPLSAASPPLSGPGKARKRKTSTRPTLEYKFFTALPDNRQRSSGSIYYGCCLCPLVWATKTTEAATTRGRRAGACLRPTTQFQRFGAPVLSQHESMVIAHDGVRSAACGAARIPAGKPGEGRRKTARGELAHLGRLDGCLRSVHQRYSVPISTGARCQHISENVVRRVGSRGGTPLVGGVGAKSPHGTPCRATDDSTVFIRRSTRRPHRRKGSPFPAARRPSGAGPGDAR